MKPTYFTLAPIDHPTNPAVLEHGYKLWSTFQRRNRTAIYVRTNKADTAGGQQWERIARKVATWKDIRGKRTRVYVWRISAGKGYLAQASKLLARYLIQQGQAVRCETEAYKGKVKRYKATAKVYSLPSILNGYKAVVSRDKQADKRRAAIKRSLADLMAERDAKNAAQ
jgi:hypothetical protein